MSLRRRTSNRLSLPRRGRAAAVVATLAALGGLLVPGSGLAADPPPCTLTWDGGAGNAYWDIAAKLDGIRHDGAVRELRHLRKLGERVEHLPHLLLLAPILRLHEKDRPVSRGSRLQLLLKTAMVCPRPVLGIPAAPRPTPADA